jgi:hypothetical protein
VKTVPLILIILVGVTVTGGQAISSVVEIVTVYSQNEQFYLRSIPYDNEFPSLPGKTHVYQTGNSVPRYEFERGFDSVDADSNNLILSNNGEVIFHAIPWEADEQKEGLKSVTIYKHGKIAASFTETEINGCDKKRERCSLLYSNFETVVDAEKSYLGTRNYKKVFKDGVDEKERFLSDFSLFSSDDVVYLTDSKKVVHTFDLKDGKYTGSESFANLFERIKSKARFTRVELKAYQAPLFSDFPKLKDGRNTQVSLANAIGMKPASSSKPRDEQFKQYAFKINSTISRDGSLEIEAIEFWDDHLPKEKIIQFFKTNKFDVSAIPRVFEKWNIGEEYFYFRNKNDRVARQEKRKDITEQRDEYRRRLTLERINGVYIPKDLGDCFIELDKILSQIDKQEMMALPAKRDMVQYHMGLGMWMRNTWGLWAGSRLQKYFLDRGIRHPDDMSGVIMEYYYDWLKGQKETWKAWEKNPQPH